jgi:hypothetical protein
MKRNSIVRIATVVFMFVAGTSLFLFSRSQTLSVEAGPVEFALKAPDFVRPASAQSMPAAIASKLDSEAGISAYFKASSPITLSSVRGLYRTIEIETSDYILGSIPVPNNWEEFDVHVFIEKSGWMLAYYLHDKPTVRIFDWQTWQGSMNPTRLQSVLNFVATSLNLSTPLLTYYHFQYPNATNLLLAIENGPPNITHSFDILATTFTYHESSWGHGGYYQCCNYERSFYYLDGVEIHMNDVSPNIWSFATGTFTTNQLPPGAPHTIAVLMNAGGSTSVMGALAIVYGP